VVWVIDGNNVMGSRPDQWWRDRPAAQRRLAEQVDRWQRAVGDEAVLVFDGPHDAEAAARSRPGLAVRFSGPAGSADDLVVALAAEAAGREGVVVVSSDRGLLRRLRSGVTAEGAGSFLRRLAPHGPPLAGPSASRD
jgi:predicted RNA-binding protein with PIN domain